MWPFDTREHELPCRKPRMLRLSHEASEWLVVSVNPATDPFKPSGRRRTQLVERLFGQVDHSSGRDQVRLIARDIAYSRGGGSL